MKFYLGLLVGSAIFIAVTRARTLDRDEPVQELQTRNLDVVDQPVHGQYHGSKQECDDMYGDVQARKRKRSCEKVKVHTLPVGQGDCAVIYCHTGHAVLFDCGANPKNHFMQPWNDGISYLQSFFSLSEVKSITVMISHADLDHYNLIPKLFDLKTDAGRKLISKIAKVIVGGPLADFQANAIKFWLDNRSIKKKVTSISDTKRSFEIVTYNFCRNKDVKFEVVAGTAANPKLKNQRGMVMKLSCESCGSQLLFAGDMEGDVAKEMVTHNSPFLRATHYKMAHHGASTMANQMNWLQAISPDEVHVSHIYNGQYSHPRCDALKRVMELTSLGVTASAHELHCFNGRNGPGGPVIRNIRQRIYSTAPTSDKICTISLTFTDKGAETKHHCYPEIVRVMPNKASSNDFPTC